MKRISFKSVAIQLTAISLLLAPGYSFAATAGKISNAASIAKVNTIKSVRLDTSSTMALREAKLLMQEKGLVLSYTITVTNNGSRTLDMLDYWVRLKGRGGKVYKPALIESDKEKKTVAPKSSVNLTYYSVVDNATKLSDLSFEIVKWDFSAANYERSLGIISNIGSTGTIPVYQGSVMLFDNTKIKGAVKQWNVTQDSSNLYLNVSFLLENGGSGGANLSTLGFALVTESNSVYDVSSQALSQSSLQPRDRKIVSLQIKLPSQLKGKKLSLVPYMKNDADKIKLPIGSFAIPALIPSPAVAANAEKLVYLEGQPIITKAATAELYQDGADTAIQLDFLMTNNGDSSIKLPAMEFMVSQGGKTYPLTFTSENNAVLVPGVEKTISLTGSLPSPLEPNAKLVARIAATETQQSYLIGLYGIETASSQGAGGSQYVYKKDYKIKLDSIYREAMEDSDVLVASLNITNTSSTSTQVPSSLSGYFMINGVKVTSATTVIGLDQKINIAPNETYHMAVYTKIPYTTATEKISFVLTETVKDSPSKTLFQFTDQQLSALQDYQTLGGYEIADIGSKASVKILSSNIYQGNNFNYFYSEFEVTNLEPRTALIAQLGGYLQDNEGKVASIKVSEVKDRIMPNGKVLVYAWGVVGKTFNLNDYGMVFGKMVKASQPPAEGQPAANDSIVVNPIKLSVKNQTPAVDTDLLDMKLSAYVISMRNINTRLQVTDDFRVEGLKLTLDYDLSLINAYDYIAPGHKIMVEFIDQETAQTTYSKEFVLGQPGENQTALKEGKATPLEIVFNDPDIQKKVNTYNTYKLNVYDVVEDAKMLIGSKEMRWFTKY